jgi:hypothetical protein
LKAGAFPRAGKWVSRGIPTIGLRAPAEFSAGRAPSLPVNSNSDSN